MQRKLQSIFDSLKTFHKKQNDLTPQCVNTAISSREVRGNNVDDQQISQNKSQPSNNSRVNECGIHPLNIANTNIVRNESPQERIKTLIIGSSILNGTTNWYSNGQSDASSVMAKCLCACHLPLSAITAG